MKGVILGLFVIFAALYAANAAIAVSQPSTHPGNLDGNFAARIYSFFAEKDTSWASLVRHS